MIKQKNSIILLSLILVSSMLSIGFYSNYIDSSYHQVHYQVKDYMMQVPGYNAYQNSYRNMNSNYPDSMFYTSMPIRHYNEYNSYYNPSNYHLSNWRFQQQNQNLDSMNVYSDSHRTHISDWQISEYNWNF